MQHAIYVTLLRPWLQAMQDERAAAAASAPLAPRPEHWSPARDAAAAAEYVTLDLDLWGRQSEEVETILQAVERCKTVGWVAASFFMCFRCRMEVLLANIMLLGAVDGSPSQSMWWKSCEPSRFATRWLKDLHQGLLDLQGLASKMLSYRSKTT